MSSDTTATTTTSTSTSTTTTTTATTTTTTTSSLTPSGTEETHTKVVNKLLSPDDDEEGNNATKLDERNLYVRGLWKDCTQYELENLFKPFGTIEQSRVNRKGIALVRFETSAAAKLAIEKMHNTRPDLRIQEMLVVKFAYRKMRTNKRGQDSKSKKEVEMVVNKNMNNVYLCYLPQYFTEKDLIKLCSTYGPLTCARLSGNGVAFVRFRDPENAQQAIEGLNGRLVIGSYRALLVKLANSDPFQPKIGVRARHGEGLDANMAKRSIGDKDGKESKEKNTMRMNESVKYQYHVHSRIGGMDQRNFYNQLCQPKEYRSDMNDNRLGGQSRTSDNYITNRHHNNYYYSGVPFADSYLNSHHGNMKRVDLDLNIDSHRMTHSPELFYNHSTDERIKSNLSSAYSNPMGHPYYSIHAVDIATENIYNSINSDSLDMIHEYSPITPTNTPAMSTELIHGTYHPLLSNNAAITKPAEEYASLDSRIDLENFVRDSIEDPKDSFPLYAQDLDSLCSDGNSSLFSNQKPVSASDVHKKQRFTQMKLPNSKIPTQPLYLSSEIGSESEISSVLSTGSTYSTNQLSKTMNWITHDVYSTPPPYRDLSPTSRQVLDLQRQMGSSLDNTTGQPNDSDSVRTHYTGVLDSNLLFPIPTNDIPNLCLNSNGTTTYSKKSHNNIDPKLGDQLFLAVYNHNPKDTKRITGHILANFGPNECFQMLKNSTELKNKVEEITKILDDRETK